LNGAGYPVAYNGGSIEIEPFNEFARWTPIAGNLGKLVVSKENRMGFVHIHDVPFYNQLLATIQLDPS